MTPWCAIRRNCEAGAQQETKTGELKTCHGTEQAVGRLRLPRAELLNTPPGRQPCQQPQGSWEMGKGLGNHMNPMQYHFAMMTKSMKGGGKGSPGAQYSTGKGEKERGNPKPGNATIVEERDTWHVIAPIPKGI